MVPPFQQPFPLGIHVLVQGGAEAPFVVVLKPDLTIDPAISRLDTSPLNGVWDPDARELTFRTGTDSYTGWPISDPLRRQQNVWMAGTALVARGTRPPATVGWYALDTALAPPHFRRVIDDGSLAGSWVVLSDNDWSVLTLAFDDAGTKLVPGSTVHGDTITGDYDAATGELTFRADYGNRTFDDYTGYVVADAAGSIALAGRIVGTADSATPDFVSGWMATRQPPNQILSAPQDQHQVPSTSPSPYWSYALTGGKTFPQPPASCEWTPIPTWPFQRLNGRDQTFTTLTNESDSGRYAARTDSPKHPSFADVRETSVAAVGTAIECAVSGADLPLTHPFVSGARKEPSEEQRDWECFLMLDPQYYPLAAVTNSDLAVSAPWLHHEQDFTDAFAHARDTLPADADRDARATLEVEVDALLLPPPYRPANGDRVLFVGRWIVDTAHDDFHTEIHPPLFVAHAAPGREPAQRRGALGNPNPDRTESHLWGRPYLVGQTFSYDDNGAPVGLYNEVVAQFTVIGTRDFWALETPEDIAQSAQITLEVPILPGWGGPSITYFLAPMSPRQNVGDELLCAWNITARSGVVVDLADNGDDRLRVTVSTTSQFRPPPPPPPFGLRSVTTQEFGGQGDAIHQLAVAAINAQSPSERVTKDLIKVLDRGALMTLYPAPAPASAEDGLVQETDTPVAELWQRAQAGPGVFAAVGDDQPYPVYGSIAVYWRRAPV